MAPVAPDAGVLFDDGGVGIPNPMGMGVGDGRFPNMGDGCAPKSGVDGALAGAEGT